MIEAIKNKLRGIALMWKGRKALKLAWDRKEVVQQAYEKSGWKSSEFWQAVLAGLAAVSAQSSGLVPEPYGAIVAASSVALYAIARGLTKRDDPLGGIKPYQSTSEFWLNLLVQVGAVSAAAAGALDPKSAAVAMTISNGAYALSRGLAKGGVQPSDVFRS